MADKQNPLTLEQRRLYFGRKRWVVDDTSVLAQMDTPTMAYEKRILLTQLNPEPVLQKIIKIRFLIICAMALALLTYLIIDEPNFERRHSMFTFIALFTFFTSLCMMAFVRFLNGSQDLVHFYDVLTGRRASKTFAKLRSKTARNPLHPKFSACTI
jgi:hypothetical protein